MAALGGPIADGLQKRPTAMDTATPQPDYLEWATPYPDLAPAQPSSQLQARQRVRFGGTSVANDLSPTVVARTDSDDPERNELERYMVQKYSRDLLTFAPGLHVSGGRSERRDRDLYLFPHERELRKAFNTMNAPPPNSSYSVGTESLADVAAFSLTARPPSPVALSGSGHLSPARAAYGSPVRPPPLSVSHPPPVLLPNPGAFFDHGPATDPIALAVAASLSPARVASLPQVAPLHMGMTAAPIPLVPGAVPILPAIDLGAPVLPGPGPVLRRST